MHLLISERNITVCICVLFFFIQVYIPRALSWAQAASEAASLGTMPRLEAKLRRKSRRQVTKSMEGQDRIQRSDRRSLGPREIRNRSF